MVASAGRPLGDPLDTRLRPLRPDDVPACAELLAALPDWFGLAEANRAYVEGLSSLPAAVVEVEGRVAGFVSIESHGPRSAEVCVMGVDPALHRRGLGRQLIGWVEGWCRENGAVWLHVKTRGPSTPDPGYERTRRFYGAQGFEPLFESRTLWGPEDAALVLVKRVEST